MQRYMAPVALLIVILAMFIGASILGAWQAGDLRNPFEPTPTVYPTNVQLPTL